MRETAGGYSGINSRSIPELEPATRIMQQYPSRRQSQKLTLVCTDCRPLYIASPFLPAGCNRPLRLLSGFMAGFSVDLYQRLIA